MKSIFFYGYVCDYEMNELYNKAIDIIGTTVGEISSTKLVELLKTYEKRFNFNKNVENYLLKHLIKENKDYKVSICKEKGKFFFKDYIEKFNVNIADIINDIDCEIIFEGCDKLRFTGLGVSQETFLNWSDKKKALYAGIIQSKGNGVMQKDLSALCSIDVKEVSRYLKQFETDELIVKVPYRYRSTKDGKYFGGNTSYIYGVDFYKKDNGNRRINNKRRIMDFINQALKTQEVVFIRDITNFSKLPIKYVRSQVNKLKKEGIIAAEMKKVGGKWLLVISLPNENENERIKSEEMEETEEKDDFEKINDVEEEEDEEEEDNVEEDVDEESNEQEDEQEDVGLEEADDDELSTTETETSSKIGKKKLNGCLEETIIHRLFYFLKANMDDGILLPDLTYRLGVRVKVGRRYIVELVKYGLVDYNYELHTKSKVSRIRLIDKDENNIETEGNRHKPLHLTFQRRMGLIMNIMNKHKVLTAYKLKKLIIEHENKKEKMDRRSLSRLVNRLCDDEEKLRISNFRFTNEVGKVSNFALIMLSSLDEDSKEVQECIQKIKEDNLRKERPPTVKNVLSIPVSLKTMDTNLLSVPKPLRVLFAIRYGYIEPPALRHKYLHMILFERYGNEGFTIVQLMNELTIKDALCLHVCYQPFPEGYELEDYMDLTLEELSLLEEEYRTVLSYSLGLTSIQNSIMLSIKRLQCLSLIQFEQDMWKLKEKVNFATFVDIDLSTTCSVSTSDAQWKKKNLNVNAKNNVSGIDLNLRDLEEIKYFWREFERNISENNLQLIQKIGFLNRNFGKVDYFNYCISIRKKALTTLRSLLESEKIDKMPSFNELTKISQVTFVKKIGVITFLQTFLPKSTWNVRPSTHDDFDPDNFFVYWKLPYRLVEVESQTYSLKTSGNTKVKIPLKNLKISKNSKNVQILESLTEKEKIAILLAPSFFFDEKNNVRWNFIKQFKQLSSYQQLSHNVLKMRYKVVVENMSNPARFGQLTYLINRRFNVERNSPKDKESFSHLAPLICTEQEFDRVFAKCTDIPTFLDILEKYVDTVDLFKFDERKHIRQPLFSKPESFEYHMKKHGINNYSLLSAILQYHTSVYDRTSKFLFNQYIEQFPENDVKNCVDMLHSVGAILVEKAIDQKDYENEEEDEEDETEVNGHLPHKFKSKLNTIDLKGTEITYNIPEYKQMLTHIKNDCLSDFVTLFEIPNNLITKPGLYSIATLLLKEKIELIPEMSHEGVNALESTSLTRLLNTDKPSSQALDVSEKLLYRPCLPTAYSFDQIGTVQHIESKTMKYTFEEYKNIQNQIFPEFQAFRTRLIPGQRISVDILQKLFDIDIDKAVAFYSMLQLQEDIQETHVGIGSFTGNFVRNRSSEAIDQSNTKEKESNVKNNSSTPCHLEYFSIFENQTFGMNSRLFNKVQSAILGLIFKSPQISFIEIRRYLNTMPKIELLKVLQFLLDNGRIKAFQLKMGSCSLSSSKFPSFNAFVNNNVIDDNTRFTTGSVYC
eukprot:TRINITY_DN3294_c3_g1_i3.p1 TRINITY_DN3294_c3_g1~~TRINITY_DN3294_c3_g1_i3.p1  ORF type:complete len:1498 (-),score=394.94 TRINITY_DN3294_c3_g1_i3:23-4516(-)